MFIYLYVYIHTYIHIYIYIYVYMYIHIRTCVHLMKHASKETYTETNTLQHTAVELQHTATRGLLGYGHAAQASETGAQIVPQLDLQCIATYPATHCNTPKHQICLGVEILCKRARLKHNSPSDTLQHTATHCNILQHTAMHCNTRPVWL